MRDAVREIGYRKLVRFAAGQWQAALLRACVLPPPFRAFFLRRFGARIGPEPVIHGCTFFNIYRTGFRGFTAGHHCFIGDETMFDLAERITLGDHVTIAERVLILTHTNMGYRAHGLQDRMPSSAAPVVIGSHSFIGANVTILEGVTVGEGAVVGAGSLVNEDVPPHAVVAGVPARVLRSLR